MEALKSPLMGIFEKRRARKFFIYVQAYNENDPKTHEGMDLTRVTTREFIAYVISLKTLALSMYQKSFEVQCWEWSLQFVYCVKNFSSYLVCEPESTFSVKECGLTWILPIDRKFGLDDNTMDFIGHAMALYRDDHYLDEPALDTVKRVKVRTYFEALVVYCF